MSSERAFSGSLRTSDTIVPMVLNRKCGSTCDCRARSSMQAETSDCFSSSKLASCVETRSAKPVAGAVRRASMSLNRG